MMESETTAKVEIATLNGGFFLSYAMRNYSLLLIMLLDEYFSRFYFPYEIFCIILRIFPSE